MRRRIAFAAIAVVVLGAALYEIRRRERTAGFDATNEPHGPTPTFAEVWRGAPAGETPHVVPTPDGRTLLVQGATSPPRLVAVRDGSAVPIKGLDADALFVRLPADWMATGLFIEPAVGVAFDPTGRYAVGGAVYAPGGRAPRRFGAPDRVSMNPTVVDLSNAETVDCRSLFERDPRAGADDRPHATRFAAGPLRIDYVPGLVPLGGTAARTRRVFVRRAEDRIPAAFTARRVRTATNSEATQKRADTNAADAESTEPPETLVVESYDFDTGSSDVLAALPASARGPELADVFVDPHARLFAYVDRGKLRASSFAAPENFSRVLADDVSSLEYDGTGFVTTHQDGRIRFWVEDRPTSTLETRGGGPAEFFWIEDDVVFARVGAPPQTIALRRPQTAVALGDWRPHYGRPEDFGARIDGARGAIQYLGRDAFVVVDFESGQKTEFRGDMVALGGGLLCVARDAVVDVLELAETPPRRVASIAADPRPVGRVLWTANELRMRAKTEGRRTFVVAGTTLRVESSTYDDRSDIARVVARGAPFALAGDATPARVAVSPRDDLFVVPSHDLTRLRFGTRARGLAAGDGAPLVGPARGEFRADDLHDGEIGGRPDRGARYAFVSDDVVAVCEPDGVFLRAVPSGRRLSRPGDPASALCLSPDGATLALLDDAGRLRLLRKN